MFRRRFARIVNSIHFKVCAIREDTMNALSTTNWTLPTPLLVLCLTDTPNAVKSTYTVPTYLTCLFPLLDTGLLLLAACFSRFVSLHSFMIDYTIASTSSREEQAALTPELAAHRERERELGSSTAKHLVSK